MVALAILAVSFTALLGTQSQAMLITSYVRDVSIASLLTRNKLTELEHHFKTDGFGSFEESESGDFSDDGYPRFKWIVNLEKIEADEAAIESMMSQAPGSKEEVLAQLGESSAFGGDGGLNLEGLNFNPAMIFSSLPMFLDQLGEKVRKVSLEISWPEGRKGRRSMSVATYFVLFEEVQPRIDSDTADAIGEAAAGAIKKLAGGTKTPPAGQPAGK
jgi:general secretion pathway protein I